MRLLRVLLILMALAVAGAAAVRGAEPGRIGIASTWGGPGAATPDCVWPWKNCASRAVQSLDTGVVILVTPSMYCDCFVGRVGPQGETERLIDLDPSMVAALGLNAADGLWKVRVWLVDPATGATPLADPGIPDTAAGEPPGSLTAAVMLALAAVLLLVRAAQEVHAWRHRSRPFQGEPTETQIATIYVRKGRLVLRRRKAAP